MKKLVASAEAVRWANRLVKSLNANREDDSSFYGKTRLDVDETNMLALQLEQLRVRAYERPYSPIQTLEITPIARDVESDAESFAWEEIDKVGEAGFIADDLLGDDLKSIEIKSTKLSRPIFTASVSFGYTFADMRRAARTGKPLSSRKLEGARQAWDRFVDRVIALGAPSNGIPAGICNWPVGTGDTQVRNTAATTAAWTTGGIVAATMLDNLNAFVAGFVLDSKGSFSPDTLALPDFLILRLNHTLLTDNKPESVMNRFMAMNPQIKRVVEINRLANVDTSNTRSRALLCNMNPLNFEAVIPQQFTLRPPQEMGFSIKVFAIGRIAGTVIYQPLALRYLTALPTN